MINEKVDPVKYHNVCIIINTPTLTDDQEIVKL